MAVVSRFEIYLVALEAGDGAKNTRPCVVVSPDEINHSIKNVIVAPIASVSTEYPTRIKIDFLKGERAIVLDQLRAVESSRLVKKIGEIETEARGKVIDCLHEMFS